MDKNTSLNYQKWLNEPSLDSSTRNELKAIENDEALINDAFYRSLEFGTGGLRGVIGAGSNRMNVYVVRMATQGLANYLNKTYEHASVAIAYDSRNFSRVFAFEAANVLSTNGIAVHIYNQLEPTPVLSFTTRYLKCDAGIVITASHNPREYNGYKVYGPDGCQITNELADKILAEINALDIFKDVKTGDTSRVNLVSDDVLNAYIESTLKRSLFKGERVAKIIYTPLHGAGLVPVTTALAKDGFNNVSVVEAQREPNGDFPTTAYPNPEFEEALSLGVKEMKEKNADILIATDPDSDRLGMASLDELGVHYFSGNEVGILLFDFITRHQTVNNGVLVKTIVTSDLLNIIAKEKGFEVREVLTGFKYIGEQIGLLEKDNQIERYVLGLEESCGYLTNTDCRDKDAVNAAMLVAEMVDELLKSGSNPYRRLEEIYNQYGRYFTKTLSYTLKGSEGAARIKELMEEFRYGKETLPVKGVEVVNDYQLQVSHTPSGDKVINLPKSNVLKYVYSNGDTITIRPSGTEPKIKIYIFTTSSEVIKETEEFLNNLIK
ncbi:MAG: phospho-sugar mutase [Bacilli bacterium]|nr:phospho-sugar mutase [Bacilli bacterium]